MKKSIAFKTALGAILCAQALALGFLEGFFRRLGLALADFFQGIVFDVVGLGLFRQYLDGNSQHPHRQRP